MVAAALFFLALPLPPCYNPSVQEAHAVADGTIAAGVIAAIIVAFIPSANNPRGPCFLDSRTRPRGLFFRAPNRYQLRATIVVSRPHSPPCLRRRIERGSALASLR